MSAHPGQGRPSSKVRMGSHGRVEQARQALMLAEEAYLRANLWALVKVNDAWVWALDGAGMRLVMSRVDAVKFQHASESQR